MVELYQAYSNPFNSSTKIRIFLPAGGHARLEIFDIRGRAVKVLASRVLGAGEYSFVRNGTDQTGRSVSSGSYFYRLISGDKAITRKALFLQ